MSTVHVNNSNISINTIRTLRLLLVFIITISMSVRATNYYISNDGDDDAGGLTEETAWETIPKLNSQSFQPGDNIYFRRGDTWRDAVLLVASSGDSENQITYGTYGSGERPEILGSLLAENWINITGDIWMSDANIPIDPWSMGYDGPEVFFEETDQTVSWGVHQSYDAGLSNLTEEYDWTWNGNRIYIYSPSNPASRYSSVEVPQNARGILLQDNNYITIDSLAIKYYGDTGIYDQYATIQLYGLRVTNCEIAYIGKKNGGAAYGLSVHHCDSYYAYNEIHNCGRRGISLTLYDTTPITEANVIIEHNHFHHGWHTTSLDCCTTGGHTIKNIIFRNNLVEGDPSVELDGVNPSSNQIYCHNGAEGTGLVKNLYFYNNIFVYAHASAIKIGTADSVYIYYNTFYNFNPTLSTWQALVYTVITTPTIVKNNVFYNNSVDNRLTCLKLTESARPQFTINNNLYYQSSTGRRFFWVDGGTSYMVEEWETYKSATGFDAASPIPSDPLFVNAPVDLRLSSNSPAIGNGSPVPLVTTDYLGNPRDPEHPTLGAYEYQDSSGINDASLEGYILYINNPNPFNRSTIISYHLAEPVDVTLRIYDAMGRVVKTLVNEQQNAGEHNITWDCSDKDGKWAKTGVYILKISAGDFNNSKKMVLLR